MSIAWPHVKQWLVDASPSLPGWAGVVVFNGKPDTGDDPLDYFTVGYVEDDSAGSWQQEQLDDFSITESGTVRADLTCQTGDDDAVQTVEFRAHDLAAALDAKLRADQTLGGVLSPNGTAVLSVEVTSIQGDGTAQSLALTLHYTSQSYS